MSLEDTMGKSVVHTSPNELKNRLYSYNVGHNFGQYIVSGREIRDKFISDITKLFSEMPVGGKLLIDFNGVVAVGLVVTREALSQLSIDIKKKRKIFGGKYLIVKDPGEDVKVVLEHVTKEYRCSLVVYYKDSNRYEVLSLPHYLRSAIDLIDRHGSLTSREMSELLPDKPVTEYLRQLHRRRLVERTPVDSGYGRVVFKYTTVRL